MTSFFYEAVDASGLKTNGSMDVASQGEALRRIKEMGLFPTRLAERRQRIRNSAARPATASRMGRFSIRLFPIRVKPAVLVVFTRQLATLVDAGMPLLRGLRILHEQEPNVALKHIIAQLASSIENGGSLSEAMSAYPKVFNRLYINMIRAGEASGSLDLTLRRLAELIEKAQKIKGKVKAAMFYPAAVLFMAAAILTAMMLFVIPRFRAIFDGFLGGAGLPAFSAFVFGISDFLRTHFLEPVLNFYRTKY
jgi:type IV pilus assembly protein PilC